MSPPFPAPVPAALIPLATAANRYPQLEGQVVWSRDGDYTFQEDGEMGLDPEEIAFYAEGLLAEGFHLAWALLADEAAAGVPLILQLTCAEGTARGRPPVPEGWCLAQVPDATGWADP